MPELTCIICPVGCRINIDKEGPAFRIEGQGCLRGKKYALEETTAPKRIVTSVVPVKGSAMMLPVKTAAPVPKDKVFSVMDRIRRAVVEAPVKIGDVILDDIAETGVALVATKSISIANWQGGRDHAS